MNSINNIVDLIQELGFSFTSSVDTCRAMLLSAGPVNETLTSGNVARILGMMSRTHNIVSDFHV